MDTASSDLSACVTLSDTGERMVPEFHEGTLMYAEHVQRYRAALGYITGKVVLDIASGSGYGAGLIGQRARSVHGVDQDAGAVAYARARHASPNVEFIQGTATEIPFASSSFDVAVTFETIEHVDDYRSFLAELRRVLRPDGLLILSTPNVEEFMKGNRFHVHEFSHAELTDALRPDYAHILEWSQTALKSCTLGPSGWPAEPTVTDAETVNVNAGRSLQPLYFYLMCSNRPVSEPSRPLLTLADTYSDRDRLLQEQALVDSHAQLAAGAAQLATATAALAAARIELREIKESRSYRYARLAAAAWWRLHGR